MGLIPRYSRRPVLSDETVLAAGSKIVSQKAATKQQSSPANKCVDTKLIDSE
ncbi:Uncharacterized protein DAT39_008936 [Clarias magur]|uniref:Uncharacterized protein n=1 Tax=Clarias magur TaxID=1594786 RepID=A0A8J4URV5_CLAMG|nr:Uncharacterized protein DAT39_008936 [Clarias magur]